MAVFVVVATSMGTALAASAPAATVGVTADIHVISVYEAVNAVAVVNDPARGHRDGVIRVTMGKSQKPLWLLVSAYEPVHWMVNVAPGARLDRIVASGYYPQRVTVSGKEGVEILITREGPGYNEGRTAAISNWVRQQYRTEPISVQTAYKGANFMVGSQGIPAATGIQTAPANVPSRKTATLMCGGDTIVCDSGDTVICGGRQVKCPVGK